MLRRVRRRASPRANGGRDAGGALSVIEFQQAVENYQCELVV